MVEPNKKIIIRSTKSDSVPMTLHGKVADDYLRQVSSGKVMVTTEIDPSDHELAIQVALLMHPGSTLEELVAKRFEHFTDFWDDHVPRMVEEGTLVKTGTRYSLSPEVDIDHVLAGMNPISHVFVGINPIRRAYYQIRGYLRELVEHFRTPTD